jgi:predicted short-subunit dehydrogenase-like oxidoreductase (DUF2520 family)
LELVQIAARHPEALAGFMNGPEKSGLDQKLRPADICILSISDRAIAEVSGELNFGSALVLHTSGGQPLSALSPLPRAGVFYPLQTFSRDRPVSLQGIPVLLESDLSEDLALLKTLAVRLGAIPLAADSRQRLAVHLAAVFANNFTNHLIHLAESLCCDSDLDPAILKPLIQETFLKLDSVSAFKAQTGPARRADKATLDKHRELLDKTPQRELYEQLTRSILDTYETKL